jgi:hypothetical protein
MSPSAQETQAVRIEGTPGKAVIDLVRTRAAMVGVERAG